MNPCNAPPTSNILRGGKSRLADRPWTWPTYMESVAWLSWRVLMSRVLSYQGVDS